MEILSNSMTINGKHTALAVYAQPAEGGGVVLTMDVDADLLHLTEAQVRQLDNLVTREEKARHERIQYDEQVNAYGTPVDRAQRGAAFFDIIRPGWVNGILNAIQVQTVTRCPAGQVFHGDNAGRLYSGYAWAFQNILPQDNPDDHAKRLGLRPAVTELYPAARKRESAELDAAWEHEVAVRRDCLP